MAELNEQRNARVVVNKVGGFKNSTASLTAVNFRVIIPNTWATDMGINIDDREVVLTYTPEKQIIIEKA